MMFTRLSCSLGALLLGTLPAVSAEPLDGEHAAFYATPEFWVAVAFVLFVIGVGRPIWRLAVTALDGRAEAIRTELNEAQRLREEAQHTLAEYQRKQRNALQEADDIIAEAKKEAARISAASQERTDALLKRREQQAIDMIAAAEARAVAEVRALAADVAIDATRRMLLDKVDGEKGNTLIDEAIREVPQKLN